MSAVVLDTHALFWLLEDHPKLGRKAAQLAERALQAGSLMVSAVSFWEAAHFLDDGDIQTAATAKALRAAAIDAGIVEVSLDGAMALRAFELLSAHRDPMDRFILATAEARKATLLTADHVLLKWRGPIKRQDASL